MNFSCDFKIGKYEKHISCFIPETVEHIIALFVGTLLIMYATMEVSKLTSPAVGAGIGVVLLVLFTFCWWRATKDE